MDGPHKEVISFFENRRSASAGFLKKPAPNREQLIDILRIGLRCPDHGRLEPWRIIVLSEDSLKKVADSSYYIGKKRNLEPEKLEKLRKRFLNSPMVLVVISSPKEGRIPFDEQVLSAGAVCISLVNAAFAHGWGANWLTGWTAHDPEFKKDVLQMEDHESISGYIHIGTNTKVLEDRDRPNLGSKVEWR